MLLLIGITVWIGIVLLLYYAYKGEKVSLANIHSVLLISMACFSFGTLIASLVISDKNSLELCWKQVRWLAYFIVAYLVAKKCKNNLVVMPALLVAVLGLALPAIESFVITGKRAQGIFSNPNYLAFMFDITLPWCTVFCVKFWREAEKIWIKVCTAIIVVIGYCGLYTTGSRGAMLGIVVSLLLVYGFAKLKTKAIAISLAVIILTGVLAVAGPSLFKGSVVSRRYDNERVLLMESSYAMWKEHKLFGVGLANWNKEYRNKYVLADAKQPKLPHSHNIYTESFATTGLVGGIPFVLMFLAMLVVLGQNAGVAGGYYTYAMLGTLIAFLIHGFFDVLTISWVMKALYPLLGIAMAEIVKDKNKVALKTRE